MEENVAWSGQPIQTISSVSIPLFTKRKKISIKTEKPLQIKLKYFKCLDIEIWQFFIYFLFRGGFIFISFSNNHLLHKHSCKREWFTYLTILIENTRVQTPYQNIQQCRDQKQDVQACLWYQRVLVITLLRNTNINLCKIHNTTVIRSFHQTQMANIH